MPRTQARERTLLDSDTKYRVRQYDGVAWSYVGDHSEPDEDTEWSGYETPTGNVVMVMVGDDREFVIDPADVTPLDENEYCPGCGQIGCKAYAGLFDV